MLRLVHDFWPIDQGVSANILASFICFIVGSAATYLIWPRVRHAVNAWVRQHFHEHRQAMDAHLEGIHHKLDHVIEHHPDIPPLEEDQP